MYNKYNKIVHDCFFAPQHVGILDLKNCFTVVFKNTQQNQGKIEFYMQCNNDRTIMRACFKTNGNPYVIASLEWLCRQLEGKNINSLPPIDYLRIINELDIPVEYYPVALRVIDAYKEALFLMRKHYI